MKKKNVNIGEVTLIPVGNDEFIPGKVLYLSKYFKNVILLAIYNSIVKGIIFPENLPKEPSIFIYTSQVIITSGRWKTVGIQPLRSQEKGRTMRIVGGSVWVEDQVIRPATDEDYKNISQMGVYGATLVEKKALELISQNLNRSTKIEKKQG